MNSLCKRPCDSSYVPPLNWVMGADSISSFEGNVIREDIDISNAASKATSVCEAVVWSDALSKYITDNFLHLSRWIPVCNQVLSKEIYGNRSFDRERANSQPFKMPTRHSLSPVSVSVHIMIDPVDKIEDIYKVRNRDSVQRFLLAHPNVLPVLEEAKSHISEFFIYYHLVLELRIDPEIPGREDLYLGIESDLGVDEALANLESLDEHWGYDAVQRANGHLCIDVELK